VLQGQTALLRLKSRPLGPIVHVAVIPATAELGLNGVPLGKGAWEGTLPAGSYVAEAAEPGYFTRTAPFVVPPPVLGGTLGSPRVALALDVDTSHPRWPKAASGRFWIGALAGYA